MWLPNSCQCLQSGQDIRHRLSLVLHWRARSLARPWLRSDGQFDWDVHSFARDHWATPHSEWILTSASHCIGSVEKRILNLNHFLPLWPFFSFVYSYILGFLFCFFETQSYCVALAVLKLTVWSGRPLHDRNPFPLLPEYRGSRHETAHPRCISISPRNDSGIVQTWKVSSHLNHYGIPMLWIRITF